MICYRDMTFCRFHADCKKGNSCKRALTDTVKEQADKWWNSFTSQETRDKFGGAPICEFADKPDCWEEKDEQNEKSI